MFNLLVALHVLLAAKSLSTNIAVVKGGCVASLGENCGYFHILHRGTWRVDQKFPQKLLVTGHFPLYCGVRFSLNAFKPSRRSSV